MAKYYDIYTQIPGIKPRTQVWVVEEDRLDVINQLLHKRDFIEIHNIVATTAKEQSNIKALICRQEYFVYMVESRYGSEHHE
ncbi:hypothetical protein [uncultured Limosilactobacillus sp.]|uniref:hypothetical protein n=1 Tax=uncultured Limosilactobacillus sp. TaxID=2837629 RepID=UPI002599B104|nr:hypothetical protein [uncultured Limosilactobacillus sp.]